MLFSLPRFKERQPSHGKVTVIFFKHHRVRHHLLTAALWSPWASRRIALQKPYERLLWCSSSHRHIHIDIIYIHRQSTEVRRSNEIINDLSIKRGKRHPREEQRSIFGNLPNDTTADNEKTSAKSRRLIERLFNRKEKLRTSWSWTSVTDSQTVDDNVWRVDVDRRRPRHFASSERCYLLSKLV